MSIRLPSLTITALVFLAATACTSSTRTAPDPRVGLQGGALAGEAISNLKLNSATKSPPVFSETMNADLAFIGNYAIQGNFNGPVIWDVTNPSSPRLVASVTCPASQNDVSVYRNLLFVSVESNSSTLDCKQMPLDTVDARRFRGVRIFDISDIRNPRLIHNVQTCRGSHTHSVLEDPRDRDNVYIYVSGSAGLRSPNELPGCTSARPDSNASSALWRIEVIKVPLMNPTAAAIVNRADIFSGLRAPATHGQAREDSIASKRAADSARAAGGYVATLPPTFGGGEIVLGPGFTTPRLDSIMKARGGSGQ
ncbi:MAG: LVIVD repeat-containing protein, partial [Gemmatimonadaceae bacterium]